MVRDMKISNEKRREVAARMREIMRDDPHGFLDIMIAQSVLDVMGEGVTIGEATANLIDRPTCNDIGDDWTFCCSVCGCELDIFGIDGGEPTMWKDKVAQVPKYCPECGRMVVNDD